MPAGHNPVALSPAKRDGGGDEGLSVSEHTQEKEGFMCPPADFSIAALHVNPSPRLHVMGSTVGDWLQTTPSGSLCKETSRVSAQPHRP